MNFAPEGWPFIIGVGIITAVVYSFGGVLYSLPLFALTIFMFSFFRDPEREIPQGKGLFVSPADGEVIVIRDEFEPQHLNTITKQVSIFMSPFNVHVNRAPFDGTVKKVVHSKGRFLAAYKDESSIQNENIAMVLETAYGDILVRQVAGFVARRAVCRKKAGDLLQRGERYGIIKFSSRVDLYLPKDTEIRVKLGDMIKAGETVIGEIES